MRAEKVQNEVEKVRPGINNNVDPKFFDAIGFPGETIKIEVGYKGAKDFVHETYTDDTNKLTVLETQLLSFMVPTFFDEFKEYMKSLSFAAGKDGYRFYIDQNKKAYGVVSHSFAHGEHFDTVYITRDLTAHYKKQIAKSLESFLFMFFWFFTMSVIGTLVCLRFIFKPLQKAIDRSFDEVVDNNYQTRIRDPQYGEEISKVIHRFNGVLDRMHELVQNNLNSMQDVSHEVKTYLTAIKQSVDVIKLYGKEDKVLVDEKLNAIEDNIVRVTSIMSTILELARLKQLSSIESANYYDAKYLINFLLRFKTKAYPDFIFETDYDAEDVEIFIDRNHFFLMMNPIVDNAVKYSIDSNVVKLDIVSKRTDNNVYLSVTNKGVVIDQKEIPHLFDRYYRGKNLESTKQGSGLGLTIAKEVMDLYKGRITVHATSDGQTSFILSFPKAVRREDSGEKS